MKLHKWISAKILNKTRLCVTDKDTEEKEEKNKTPKLNGTKTLKSGNGT